MASSGRLAEVVVTLPVEGRFHYLVPEKLEGHLEVGHRVLVPFGGRRVTGFVLGLDPAAPSDLVLSRLKPIEARLDAEPLLFEGLLELCRFAADYYLAPPGEVLKAALPPGFTGASKVRYSLTPEGRKALDEGRPLPGGAPPDPEHLSLLEAARGSGLPRSRARSKPARELEEVGWIAPRHVLSAKDGGGETDVVARRLPPALAEPWLMGAKTRRALYEALSEGARPLEALRRDFGTVRLRNALKRLVQDGVLEIRAEARAAEDASRSPAPKREEAVASAVSSSTGSAGLETPDSPRADAEPAEPAEPAEAAEVRNAPIAHPSARPPLLTSAQRAALEAMIEALENDTPKAFLLQGVTGSGKTEVYLGLIEHALSVGRGAIVLVPEIALTPQLEDRFRARFGEAVAVLHSAVPDAERRRRWLRLRQGEARIALGPRSAVWAPVDRLGVVVVDEEHDASFKQQSELRYHGRDLALVRASQVGAVAVLGSATPSLEALHLVERGRLVRLRLDARVAGRPMPSIQLVDLVEERRAMKGDPRLLSRALEDGLREAADRNEQAILFLNRRGFNTIVHCGACDDVKKCPRCDVSLTYHKADRKLACHYCGFEERLDSACRSCRSRDVRPLGAGTERVVAAVRDALPDVRILRLDRDTTQRAGGLEEVLGQFRRGEADVLVGTQMVAKGHDFPRVTLVGIVLADASLAFPDFRAAERTFQLLTQVSGRAGRAERPGRVIIQTFQPDHYAVQAALEHDVDRFFGVEGPMRREAGYPPYARLGVVRAESLDAGRAEQAADRVAHLARRLAREPAARVLGPAPAPIGKVKDRYRYLTLLFAPTPARLVEWMRRTRRSFEPTRGVDLIFDVDAVDLL